MSVDQIDDQPPLAARDVDRRREARNAGTVAAQAVGDELPRVVIVERRPTDAIEELLLSVARGDRQAFDALKHHMGGHMHVNIRHVLATPREPML